MPIKFKPSEKVRGKEKHSAARTVNYYMHTIELHQLYSVLANSNTTGKRKQKIRNEIVRRGEPMVPVTVE